MNLVFVVYFIVMSSVDFDYVEFYSVELLNATAAITE